MRRQYIGFLLAVLLFLAAQVQTSATEKWVNFTKSELQCDSVLPRFAFSQALPLNYQDSLYTAQIVYPEFVDMPAEDVEHYLKLVGDASTPGLPQIEQHVGYNQKMPLLNLSLVPVVLRNGRYQYLASFMLRITAKGIKKVMRISNATSLSKKDRYAANSVLAHGTWAKIRVSASGVYQLTDELIRKAGFTDLNKVCIYGYGGRLQNEKLNGDDLKQLDDLQQVPTCYVGGKRLFYAVGTVTWDSKNTLTRRRNPYSDYGYYFITQGDSTPVTIDSTAFLNSFYPSNSDYHYLYEKDGFAWYQGGRNLFDTQAIELNGKQQYILPNTGHSGPEKIKVAVTAGVNSTVAITINGKAMGNIAVRMIDDYDKGQEDSVTYSMSSVATADTITLQVTAGGPVHLDYISKAYSDAAPKPNLTSAQFGVPEYVYNITNQNHHADGAVDMVIIIPTSQKLLAQAQRLKDFHEQHDSMRVRIVPADELYNEFSSGTPDANAYRRYLKMLYDRADSAADMPKYLVLFGDCVWDNRMLTSDCKNLDPDDYLLAFESENSFNEVTCYVDDGFYALLDDGEGTNPKTADLLDMAVGRFPVSNADDAKAMVDKTINYVNNKNAGSWQNTVMFLGDDGNYNLHMNDINDAAEDIMKRYPGYLVKKVMWDAYTRQSLSVGKRYPEVTAIIKQQQAKGALVFDYGGHGRADQISHEAVLTLNDFKNFTNDNLPLWITASCDVMPFDGTVETIGEQAVLNSNGGAVAFFGTTRTVYSNYNKIINMAFLQNVLGATSGKMMTLGEAQRLAKNKMITQGLDRTENKLQYSLLGDPAISLAAPTYSITVDSINNMDVSNSSDTIKLKTGSVVRVVAHVDGAEPFDGEVTATVLDSRELITCKQNDKNETTTAFTYYDRSKTIYTGSNNIKDGKIEFSFVVPRDVNYSDQPALINLYARSNDNKLIAHGSYTGITLNGGSVNTNDTIGPKIYCYLNSDNFTNGDVVNTTPYFYASMADESGINVSGNGIGHNLELIVDGKESMTYNLNDNFSFEYGSYQKGSTWYQLPALETGSHTLVFRAWDMLNNASEEQLQFRVDTGVDPQLLNVNVSNNPATTSTTFIIGHDRSGADIDVCIDVFDTSGRILWKHSETATSASSPYSVTWDLCNENGGKLQTGLYLYRVRLSCEGSSRVSKTRKLIILNNN